MTNTEKLKLRIEIIEKLKTFSYKRSASARIAELFKLNISPFIERTDKIGIFYPLKTEVDVLQIAKELPPNSLLLPVCRPNSEIMFYPWVFGEKLKKSFYFKSIYEPEFLNLEAKVPNFLITPLIACDTQGNRIGNGMGYYDRYLNKYREKLISIGICYDFQLLKKIPCEDHDQKLDIIITDKQIINNYNLSLNKDFRRRHEKR